MSWVVPVGVPGGICSGLDGTPDGSGVVRLGNQVACVDPQLYRLWLAAASAPSPMELISWASENGIDGAEEDLPALLSEGLLLSDGGDVEARVGVLAAVLTGECVGNGPSRAAGFGILGTRGARLDVDGLSFDALLRSDGVSSLASIGAELDASQAQSPDPPTLTRVVRGLPLLIRSGVIRLQAVPTP
jgi:hypothetical protein